MIDYQGIVQTALDLFQSPIVPLERAEEGKAQLTRLAAYLIQRDHDPSARLLTKTSGNNVNGRSVDLIILAERFADVATERKLDNGLAEIKAQWIEKPHDGTTGNQSLWIVPTEAIAHEAGPMTLTAQPQPDPEPGEPTEPTDPNQPTPPDYMKLIELMADETTKRLRPAIVEALKALELEGTIAGSLPIFGKVNLPVKLKAK